MDLLTVPTRLTTIAAGFLMVTTASAATADPGIAGPYQRPGANERISMGLDGGPANGRSYTPSMSDDGRYVVFYSQATNLVTEPLSGAGDIFRHDRATGRTELVSVARDGGSGNGSAFQPVISGDGHTVAFLSYATDLVEGDTGTPTWAQVFVRDLVTGTTTRVTAGPSGGPANGGSLHTAISRDGRHVAFLSHASDLVSGDTNGVGDVFVHDLQTGTTKRVSTAQDGSQSDGISTSPAFSGDGEWLAFFSRGGGLVSGVNEDPLTTPVNHAYIRNLHTGDLELVSASTDGASGNMDSSGGLAVSGEGRFVAFQSTASNLVPNDTNGEVNSFDGQDVFVRDRLTGATERVSVASTGDNLPGKSVSTSISDDGRFVAFQSLKEGEDPQSFVAESDAYVHDRLTRVTELVTVSPDGAPGDGDTKNPKLSPDGSLAVFQTDAANLVDGEAPLTEVVLRERGPAAGVYATRTQAAGDRREVSGYAGFSGRVLSSSSASPSGPGDLTGASVTYRHEEADLLVRLRVHRVPRAETPAATRPLAPTYGLAFSLDGDRHEIRAVGLGAAVPQAPLPAFGLYACHDTCALVAELEGGFGTGGEEIRVALPLGALDLTAGSTLESMEAFRSAAPLPLPAPPVGGLPLSDASIPAASLHLGVGGSGTPPSQVPFDTVAEVTLGAFDADVPWAANQRLWARTCLGQICDIRVIPHD